MTRDNARMVLVLLLGLVIGAGVTWGIVANHGTQVEIVEGHTTNVNETGIGIGLATEPGGPGKGYSIGGAFWRESGGAFWRESGGAWNTHNPTCLEPLTSGQEVRLGVLQAPPGADAPGGELVVWLECLD